MDADVANNQARSRYELTVDGRTAIAAYKVHPDHLDFYHTEVPAALEGRGIGTRLIAGALADVRRRGLRIVATCPFVRHYLETHPEEEDLVLR